MIDLTCTREHLLADINASGQALANRLDDASDPGFVDLDEACLTVRGSTPDDLLPGLGAALSRRFAHVPEKRLVKNLLYLLKKGVGNAYKWGNRRDPTKSIVVEAVVTGRGAVVSISDEGGGFDAQGTVDRFRAGERHYTHGGSGFRHFEKAKSLVSYANGGRTLLIRFSCAARPHGEAGALEGSPSSGQTRS